MGFPRPKAAGNRRVKKYCAICGKEFDAPPSGRKSCGAECFAKLRIKPRTAFTQSKDGGWGGCDGELSRGRDGS
jgi:hypothetical protein